MKLHRQITNELIGQEEIEKPPKPPKERKTASEMTFQRYLSPINKGSIVEVLDLPATVPRGGGGWYLGQFLLDMCRWPLRTPTPLQYIPWPIIGPILVTFGLNVIFAIPS